jgi:hypothetical protein
VRKNPHDLGNAQLHFTRSKVSSAPVALAF